MSMFHTFTYLIPFTYNRKNPIEVWEYKSTLLYMLYFIVKIVIVKDYNTVLHFFLLEKLRVQFL